MLRDDDACRRHSRTIRRQQQQQQNASLLEVRLAPIYLSDLHSDAWVEASNTYNAGEARRDGRRWNTDRSTEARLGSWFRRERLARRKDKTGRYADRTHDQVPVSGVDTGTNRSPGATRPTCSPDGRLVFQSATRRALGIKEFSEPASDDLRNAGAADAGIGTGQGRVCAASHIAEAATPNDEFTETDSLAIALYLSPAAAAFVRRTHQHRVHPRPNFMARIGRQTSEPPASFVRRIAAGSAPSNVHPLL